MIKRQIPWKLIIAHLKDELTQEEKELFLQWVAIPGNNQLYQHLVQLWNEVQKDSSTYHPDINFYTQEVKRRISHSKRETTIHGKRTGKKYRIAYQITVAASLIFLFWGGYTWWASNTKSKSIEYIAKILEKKKSTSGEILLVMSGEKEIEVTPNSSIVYSEKGEVNVNSKQIKKQVSQKKADIKQDPEYDQLVVPKGKRTFLNLSDGSKLWVNSGSRVIYPRVFAPDKREIYVDGEAYLEVQRNEQAPFIVKTARFDVKVLGTSFNISAYQEMETSSVVLVEGAVNIKDSNNTESNLLPSEAVVIKNGTVGNKETVDTKYYTTWTKGFLLLKSEPISSLMDKLNYYYGKKIIYGNDIKDLKLSGKLDLKENIEEVFEMIASSTAIIYRINEDDIYITKRVQ